MKMARIDPGQLRTELVLLVPEDTPDQMGGTVREWNAAGTVFALVEPLRASALFGAGQQMQTVTHRITLRHRDGVEAGHCLARGERRFDVMTVRDPDESGRYLVCEAVERTP